MNKNFLIIISAATLLIACNNSSTKKKENDFSDSTTAKTVVLLEKAKFDTVVDSRPVTLYYLKNKNNFQAAVTNYGARMVSFVLPGKDGEPMDVVVGFDNIKDYIIAAERYFGCIVGRFGNRIAKGQFTLDGKKYQLDLNNGVNSLHGGRTGFHSRVWDAVQSDSQKLVLTYVSADGEEGYPGRMTTQATYKLTDDNELQMSYEITTDKKTIVNVTNHNYWNLNGEGSGTINNHELFIKAANYTPVDSTLIPTGNLEPVAGTPFDFTTLHKIGERIDVNNTQLRYGKGYDHNYVLDKGITAEPELITTVKGDLSGIVMDIYTTEPAIQFYGGNFMQSLHTLKTGAKDDFRTAFCLETQHYPDAPNQPAFPTTVLEPGKKYISKTVHKFYVK
ncbi:MAG: galactose mutarotase [Chitinophagaceae bacterium]|nr:galactose mutarotase [Chitinophagaceae bacterium]